eukprot:4650799-Prorocentrum_lima.AAC.1
MGGRVSSSQCSRHSNFQSAVVMGRPWKVGKIQLLIVFVQVVVEMNNSGVIVALLFSSFIRTS